jgi:hypothetical protein
MSTFSTNLKVSLAVSGATTVPANSYAIVEYYRSGYNQNNAGSNVEYTPIIFTRHFGPLQSIPATFNLQCDPDINNAGAVIETVCTLLGGVIFANTQ